MKRLLCRLFGHNPAKRLLSQPMSEQARADLYMRLRASLGVWDPATRCLRCGKAVRC